MDVLRKMFKSTKSNDLNETITENGSEPKNEFRKPQWFEEVETDDELFDDDRKFAFQVFTNPMELQKHFEQQMRQVLEAISEFEGNEVPMEKNLKEEFLKPGFETNLFKELEEKGKTFMDTDLDGEIYADELHSLLQRMNKKPSETLPHLLPRNDSKIIRTPLPKLNDEEKIMGIIHGTYCNDDNGGGSSSFRKPNARMRPEMMTPMIPMLPRSSEDGGLGGVFDGSYHGPKMFSQSVLMKTIRKPDGSYETTKVTQDAQGKRVTTITRTDKTGHTETITKNNDADGNNVVGIKEETTTKNRNLFVTKEGYAMPRNLW